MQDGLLLSGHIGMCHARCRLPPHISLCTRVRPCGAGGEQIAHMSAKVQQRGQFCGQEQGHAPQHRHVPGSMRAQRQASPGPQRFCASVSSTARQAASCSGCSKGQGDGWRISSFLYVPERPPSPRCLPRLLRVSDRLNVRLFAACRDAPEPERAGSCTRVLTRTRACVSCSRCSLHGALCLPVGCFVQRSRSSLPGQTRASERRLLL